MDGTDRADDTAPSSRRLILNPACGHASHSDRVQELADAHGFPVDVTDHKGHAAELAKAAAAAGVELLAVCGGDGTLNEVVQGLYAAEALDAVTLCVIPAGTENIVAGELGVGSVTEGFEVAESGATRQLDLGVAGGEPFVMSAIVGLPADVSAAAAPDLKRRFGSLGFVVGAVREGLSFDEVRLEVDVTSAGGDLEWRGEALAVLAGNLRRFEQGGGQANAEDGLLDLAIVERMPPGELAAEAIEQRLLHRETPHVHTVRAASGEITCLDGDPLTVSLDGEIRTVGGLALGVVPRSLRLRVGQAYEPHPT